MNKNIIIDMNNIAWIIRHASKLEPKKVEAYATEYIAMCMIDLVCNMYKENQGTGILCTYDSSNVWRKTIYADYKNRGHDDIYHEVVRDAVDMTKEFFDTVTNIKTAKVSFTEADDIIGVAVQENTIDCENVIISADKDFVQLLGNPKTTLYSPSQKKFRVSDDPEYDLFLKCVRGDKNDNIFSCYPRVRETVIHEAFSTPESYTDFMETILKSGDKVGKGYDLNQNLIDLRKQPVNIRERIVDELNRPTQMNFNNKIALEFARDHHFKANIEKFMDGEYTSALKSEYVFDDK
jgi:hypothetical protein